MSYEKLIIEQQQNITEYREKYFAQATSCLPADRPRAEAAARKIGELAGIKIDKIYWVNNPIEAASLWKSLSASLRESLRDSLCDSLRESLWDSLWGSLRGSLWESLWKSLRVSLWKSLRDSLRNSLRNSLWESLGDSLSASGYLCFYSYYVDVLGIEINDAEREKLRLHNEIAASCFAIWVAPGAAILCERPQSIKIVNGKLVDIYWRQK